MRTEIVFILLRKVFDTPNELIWEEHLYGFILSIRYEWGRARTTVGCGD